MKDDSDLRNLYARISESVQVPPGVLGQVAEDMRDEAHGKVSRRVVSKSRIGVVAGVAAALIVSVALFQMRDGGRSDLPSSGAEVSGARTSNLEYVTFSNKLTGAADKDDRYVGAIERQDVQEIVLHGTGASPPPDLLGLIAEAPVGVRVVWTEVPYTESQLRAAMTLAQQNIPGVVSTSYPNFDHVVVEVTARDDADLESLQRMADALATPVPLEIVPGSAAQAL